jgi:hypothetical protein
MFILSASLDNIGDGEHSPSSPRKGWTPTTRIDCKLAIYKPSPDDGEGVVLIWKFGDSEMFSGKFGEHCRRMAESATKSEIYSRREYSLVA